MGIEVSLICHATEDEKLIKKAVEETLSIKLKQEKLQGHFENPIIMLSSEVTKKKAKDLSELIKKNVEINDFKLRSDENLFFIRLSKEAFLKNKIKLGKDVRVKFSIQLYPTSSKKVEEFMREFWNA